MRHQFQCVSCLHKHSSGAVPLAVCGTVRRWAIRNGRQRDMISPAPGCCASRKPRSSKDVSAGSLLPQCTSECWTKACLQVTGLHTACLSLFCICTAKKRFGQGLLWPRHERPIGQKGDKADVSAFRYNHFRPSVVTLNPKP